MLREVPELVDELSGGGPAVRDWTGSVLEHLVDGAAPRWEPVAHYGPPPARLAADPCHPLVVRAGQPVEHVDQVASLLPAGPMPGAARGGRVSGSAEPRLPINEDAVDLLSHARSLRRTTTEDDIGFLPVASTLDFWAEDLRQHRDRGERRPDPSVGVLTGWLGERIDEAADDWLPFDEFFEDLRRVHGALLAQCGRIDIPDYRRGVPCPKCAALTLLRPPGSDYIECLTCPAVLSIPEYEEHVRSMSAEEVAKRRAAAVERRAVRRLLEQMHAVGWRHRIRWEEDHDPETGAPEAYRMHEWRRGDEQIEAHALGDSTYGSIGYTPDSDALYGGGLIAGAGWVAENSVKRLHALASAAGVLSVPKERQ